MEQNATAFADSHNSYWLRKIYLSEKYKGSPTKAAAAAQPRVISEEERRDMRKAGGNEDECLDLEILLDQAKAKAAKAKEAEKKAKEEEKAKAKAAKAPAKGGKKK